MTFHAAEAVPWRHGADDAIDQAPMHANDAATALRTFAFGGARLELLGVFNLGRAADPTVIG
jgi:hypothetical protein